MNEIVGKLGGRKAAACITGLAVSVGCLLYLKELPDQLVDIIKYLVATYVAGNVLGDLADGARERLSQERPAPVVDTSRIEAQVNQLNQVVGTQDATIRQIIEHISKQAQSK